MKVSRRAASSSALSAADAGATPPAKDGAQRGFRLHVRRANLSGNKVARLAAVAPVATQELAAARAELLERADKMRAAAGEQANDVCSEPGQALALLALLQSDRGLAALRAMATLVADARSTQNNGDDAVDLGLLLRARPAGADGGHVEVPLTSARSGIKLTRLALADYPWSGLSAKFRGDALPAIFPLGGLWAGVPERLGGHGWLADVGRALAKFRDGGTLPVRFRVPLYTATIELRERCGLHWHEGLPREANASASLAASPEGAEAAQGTGSVVPTDVVHARVPTPVLGLALAPADGPATGGSNVGLGISLPRNDEPPASAQATPPACAPADEEAQLEAAALFSSQLTLRPSAASAKLSPPAAFAWYDDDDDDDDDELPPLPPKWTLPPARRASFSGELPGKRAVSAAPAPPPDAAEDSAHGAPSPVPELELGLELVFPTLLPAELRSPRTPSTATTDAGVLTPVNAATPSPASSPVRDASPSQAPSASASPASVAEQRGRSPTSQARLWSEPAPPGAQAPASPVRTASLSRVSSPALSACSLPSSVPMSSRANSLASQRSDSPLSLSNWAAPLRGPSNLGQMPYPRSPRSSDPSTVGSPSVWTPAASSEAGISDEDWAEAAVQQVPTVPASQVVAVASQAVSAAGWGLGLLRSWVGVDAEGDATRGVHLGAAEIGRVSGAPEVAEVSAAELVQRWRAGELAQATGHAGRERARLTLSVRLSLYVQADAAPQARRARCIEAVGALADDELAAAWAMLVLLPADVADAAGASAGARLLRCPPPQVDAATCALAAGWLRRLAASPGAAATLWQQGPELGQGDDRKDGEFLGRLENSMELWCEEPALLPLLGRTLATAGEAAPKVQRGQWVRAAAAGDGGPLVEALRQVSAGSPLLLSALVELEHPNAKASATALDAVVSLAVEKFASKRNVSVAARESFEQALAALLNRQERGWARLDWAQAVSWRLYEAAGSVAQASALDAAVATAVAKKTKPSVLLAQATQYVGPGVQLQLAARLVAFNVEDVVLAKNTAKVIARLVRQQAASPGTLRQRDAAAVAGLVYACGGEPEAWQGHRRDAGLVVWHALNAAEFLLTPCVVSGFTAEAAEIVHDAFAAPTLTPTKLWGASTGLAALTTDGGQRPALRLVAALGVRAEEAERQERQHAEALARRRTLPAELQKLAARLSTSRAGELRQQAWQATAKRLQATHENVRRFNAMLATQLAGHLARLPLPPQTAEGSAAARDWTEAMLELVEARQHAFAWMGSEPPLQALRQRLRAFADAYVLVDAYVGEALLPDGPLSAEGRRVRTLRNVPTFAAFVDAVPEDAREPFLEGLAPTLYLGHGAYAEARAKLGTASSEDSLRLTAWQGILLLLPAYLDAAQRSGARDGYTTLQRYQREVVRQLAAESYLGLQGARLRQVVERSLRQTQAGTPARAAVMQATLDGLRLALLAYTDWSSAATCAWRLQEVLRLGWALATHDPAHTEFAVELLEMTLLLAHESPAADQVVDSLALLLSDAGMGIDEAELTRDEARLQAGMRQAVAMYADVGPRARTAQPLQALVLGQRDWRGPARQDAWDLAQAAWAEDMAPGKLGANYLRLAQQFPQGAGYQELLAKDEMQYLDYAMLDADTRRELLTALVEVGELAPALNDGLLGRMAYYRPLSPSEQALAQRVAGYAGPYVNVAQGAVESTPA